MHAYMVKLNTWIGMIIKFRIEANSGWGMCIGWGGVERSVIRVRYTGSFTFIYNVPALMLDNGCIATCDIIFWTLCLSELFCNKYWKEHANELREEEVRDLVLLCQPKRKLQWIVSADYPIRSWEVTVPRVILTYFH